MNRILIIQTAFIGDVILATSLIERVHQSFPSASIDFVLRKGNEGLFAGHPFLRRTIIWDKKQGKYTSLFLIIKEIRKERYDCVINLQRFLSTGLLTVFSGGKKTIGFDKNPLSLLFSKRYPHVIDTTKGSVHEIDRNLSLLSGLVNIEGRTLPKLYPRPEDFEKVRTSGKYITISPASVWFTKQYPLDKWMKVTNLANPEYTVFLLGGKSDLETCQWIKERSTHKHIEIMAGKLSFLESAALMKGAVRNYVNDSAPLHIASAVNAPVTAVFCSTVPAFGFGPLSSDSKIAEIEGKLYCRPCGLHGYKACPESHFKCSEIAPEKVLKG